MVYIIVWVLMAIIVGLAGRARAGGFLGFFVASLLFSPIVALLFLILGRSDPTPR